MNLEHIKQRLNAKYMTEKFHKPEFPTDSVNRYYLFCYSFQGISGTSETPNMPECKVDLNTQKKNSENLENAKKKNNNVFKRQI